MAPGQSRTVEVPSEATFLRVHLPSGRTAILQDPGNLDRLVTHRFGLDEVEQALTIAGKDTAVIKAVVLPQQDSVDHDRDGSPM